jgi:6-phosphogluconolactonase
MLCTPSISETATDAYNSACSTLLEKISLCTTDNQKCVVVVAGGKSVHHVLRKAFSAQSNWGNVIFVLADERCLPVGDSQRNDTALISLIDSHSLESPPHLVSIPAERGPVDGSIELENILKNIGQPNIVMISVADDGHLASLFPHSDHLFATTWACAITDSTKAPRERVTCSMAYFATATHRIALQTGHNKRDIFVQLQQGERLPLAVFSPTHWFLDSDAAT